MVLAGCQVVLNVIGGQDTIAIDKKQIGCRAEGDAIIADAGYPKPFVFLSGKANRTNVTVSKGPYHALSVIARTVVADNHLELIDSRLIRDR